jgi:hypothetical protein
LVPQNRKDPFLLWGQARTLSTRICCDVRALTQLRQYTIHFSSNQREKKKKKLNCSPVSGTLNEGPVCIRICVTVALRLAHTWNWRQRRLSLDTKQRALYTDMLVLFWPQQIKPFQKFHPPQSFAHTYRLLKVRCFSGGGWICQTFSPCLKDIYLQTSVFSAVSNNRSKNFISAYLSPKYWFA